MELTVKEHDVDSGVLQNKIKKQQQQKQNQNKNHKQT